MKKSVGEETLGVPPSFLPSSALLSPLRIPRTCFREPQPRRAPTVRREVGETRAAEMGSIDVNFPAPCLTFQRHHRFPTLAVILLNDSNLYLVSLPTPSLSQLILFSFSPPLCGEGTVDRHSSSMAFEVPVGGSLSQGFPFSLSLEFTRDSTLYFSTQEGKWSK